MKGGHTVFITGTDDQGVIVSTWKGKYCVTWDNLEYAPFAVVHSKIESSIE